MEMAPFVQRAHGSDAYAQFADTWLRAFPDAVFTMEHVEHRNETMCEVDLIAVGTHTGLLDLGDLGTLKPSGVRLTLMLRELLEIRDGKICTPCCSSAVQAVRKGLPLTPPSAEDFRNMCGKSVGIGRRLRDCDPRFRAF
jgi:predicted ester cyclase